MWFFCRNKGYRKNYVYVREFVATERWQGVEAKLAMGGLVLGTAATRGVQFGRNLEVRGSQHPI